MANPTTATPIERAEAGEKAAWLATFPEHNPHPIVEIEVVQGTIHYANPAALCLFPDLPALALSHPFLAHVRAAVAALTSGSLEVFHAEIRHAGRCFSQSISLVNSGCFARIYSADITQGKQAEEAQLRLVAIINSSHDAIIGKTLEGVITSWNPAAERMFGYAPAEIIGSPLLVLIPPDRADEEPQILARIARGERVEEFETLRVCKDGRQIPVTATVSPIRDADGTIIGASQIARDVTERRTAAQLLNASLKEVNDLKAALDEHAIVAITDPQGRITYVNDKFCAISKYSREELLGQDHRIINSGYHPKDFIREIWTTIAHGQVWKGEIKNKAKDGSFYWVATTIVPFLNEQGKPYQYVAIRADITARKADEERLKASLKEVNDLKAALDEHAIVAITDPQGRITYVNDKFCAISKYSREELLGQDHRIINSGYHSKDFIREIWTTITHGYVWKGEIKNKAKDGSFYWVDTTIVPFLTAHGKPYQYVAIRADITDRKSAEARAEELNSAKLALQAEALQHSNEALERSNVELQQFAYIASHDLQTPLRNISGFVQLLQLNYTDKLDTQAHEWIRRTTQSCEHMHNLIRDVLAYSRVDSKARPFLPTPFAEVFRDAVALLDTSIMELGGEVTSGPLPTVRGDRSQLVQLMQNLIGNGLKYHGKERPCVHVSARQEGPEWVISVRDNGIGIATKHQERVFEIFRRLHDQQEYPGTGIGLAICRRVVMRHGGRIWVESTPGQGSTFHFTIPESTSETP